MPEKKPAKKPAAKKPAAKAPAAKTPESSEKVTKAKAKGKPCPLAIVPGATFDDVLLEAVRFPARSAHELGALAGFEAAARHGERAATLLRQALASTEALRPWAIAASVSPALVALAQAPGTEALVTALLEDTFARVKDGAPDETHYDLEQRIGVWLELAVAADAAGNRARAKELVDGAMTALAPSLDRLDSRVIARAAGALLAVGDTARAKDVLTRRSHDLRLPLEARAVRGDLDGVRLLLEVCSDFDCRSAAEQAAARGHAAIVEAFAPRLEKSDPLCLGIARASLAAHADPSTWGRLFDEAFSVSPQQGGMFGSILLDAIERRAPEKVPAVLDALAPALEKAAFVDFIPWWRCVGALAAAGRDVGKAIKAGAKHPISLLEALSHGGAHHAAVAELAKGVRAGSEGELAKVAAALLRAGHPDASQEFLDKALEAAGSDRFKCVNVALELAAVGSAEGVWRALKQVSKARRINALEDLIAAQAQRGRFDVVVGLLRSEPTLTWNAVYQAGFGGALFLSRA